jgi:hypothetical protein
MFGISSEIILIVLAAVFRELTASVKTASTSYQRGDDLNFCRMTVRYEASQIEQEWYREIGHVAEDDAAWTKGCTKMRLHRKEVSTWLNAYNERESWVGLTDLGHHRSKAMNFPHNVMSYHHYEEKCGDKRITKSVPLEPLMGFLRHPLSICFDGASKGSANLLDHVVNKSCMLPMFAHEVVHSHNKISTSPYRRYLFDVGASLYSSGLGGASQEWFVNTYRLHGLDFDRILAWEAQPLRPEDIFSEVPPEIFRKMSYFNIKASSEPNSKYNPLVVLQELCRVEDFVVLKIDIDNDKVEVELINLILQDPDLSAKIDELYFEHHTTLNPLNNIYWYLKQSAANITTSYELFTALRNRGIRAHSWV